MTKQFKNFEEFASYDWPQNRPTDCTRFPGTDTDCFEHYKESDRCVSCMEYERRLEAWDFVEQRPEPRWWSLITTQHDHDDAGNQLETISKYAKGRVAE